MTTSSYAESICLPTDQVFKNLQNAKRFAIDIGGSLAKIAYYSTVMKKRSLVLENNKSNGGIYELTEADEICEQLHFIKFESRYIETCLDFIQKNLVGSKEFMQNKCVKVTGGGAFKYKELIEAKLGLQVEKEDEMACTISGCNFLLKHITDEVFIYERHGSPEYRFQGMGSVNVFPYLLVNIGSGVSIVKVNSEDQFERIGGTSIGGGTFWGLGSILTKAHGFDDLLKLAEQGDHRKLDVLVKDVYGGAYAQLDLPRDLIACSFGKAAKSTLDKKISQFQDEDIAKSLLITISNDIGQIATLNAQLHGLKHIYFGGYFIRGHPITMHTISYAVNYWSKGEIQALFLRHEGYLGAIGAFLKGVAEQDADKYSWGRSSSWQENYAGSSGLPRDLTAESKCDHLTSGDTDRQPGFNTDASATFDMLELDRFSKQLVSCPLLQNVSSYKPDTVDLTQDKAAREYWLQCFEDAIDKFAERAVNSQPGQTDAGRRAKSFKNKYLNRLKELRINPCSFGHLTVRSLLDTREHCMEEFHFVDPYSQQKQFENEAALKCLRGRLQSIDRLPWEERQLALAKGLLAGNVFDWGAKAVASMMESDKLDFNKAMQHLQGRPWLCDDFDSWRARLREGPTHKCAVIFVDNSGIDIILGVFPLVRELLSRKTKVILCANSRPALNDVTYNELKVLTNQVAGICAVVKWAMSEGQLMVMESGQGSPCLDLRYIDHDLAVKMKEVEADLVILEGMGRAIHTNYNAFFSCDTLKVAVLKNQWLATRLGGHMFSVVFKFEPRTEIGDN